MKHVGAEIKHRFLVDDTYAVLTCFVHCNIIGVLYREPLNEVADLIHELAFLKHGGETLLA